MAAQSNISITVLSSVTHMDTANYEDLAELENISDLDQVVNLLKTRFESKDYFAFISNNVLLYVNPYTELEIFTDGYIESYAAADHNARDRFPAHVYETAERAYRESLHDGVRAVILSGESASGKTYLRNQMLQYLAFRGSLDDQFEVEDKLNAVILLLEAFGGAKTVVNPSSSRYGSFFECYFNADGYISGASLQCFYLESNRVVEQFEGESNFFVFYPLLQSLNERQLSELGIGSDLKYLMSWKSLETKGPSIESIREAMSIIGIDTKLQEKCFDILLAILLLGELDFSDQVICRQQLDILSLLLQVKPVDLENAFKKTDKIDLACRSMAITLYRSCFKYLIRMMNESLAATSKSSRVCIFDAPGFENISLNNMERFCINFCDEVLQNLLNQMLFVDEQLEYENDGLPWEKIPFFDNSKCVHLLAGSNLGDLSKSAMAPKDGNSVIGLLNAISTEAKSIGNAESLLVERLAGLKLANEVVYSQQGNGVFFGVKHFAGDCLYDAEDLVNSNVLPYKYHFDDTFRRSDNLFLRGAFDFSTRIDDLDSVDPTKPAFVVSRFYEPFQAVLRELGGASCSFVRCVKTNDMFEPNGYNLDCVRNQLEYGNILECIQIKSRGYAFRYTFVEFFHEYGLVLLTKEAMASRIKKGKKDKYATRTDLQPKCGDILERAASEVKKLGLEPFKYHLGLNHVYLHQTAGVILDYLVLLRKDFWATQIQKVWKGHKVRNEIGRRLRVRREQKLNAAKAIQRCFKAFLFRKRFKSLKQNIEKIKLERGIVETPPTSANSAWEALSVSSAIEREPKYQAPLAKRTSGLPELIAWIRSYCIDFDLSMDATDQEFVHMISNGKLLLKLATSIYPQLQDSFHRAATDSSSSDRVSLFLDTCEKFSDLGPARIFSFSDLAASEKHSRVINGLLQLKEQHENNNFAQIDFTPVDVTNLNQLKENRRNSIIELIKTEELFVDALNVIADFRKYLTTRKVVLNPAEIKILFGNIDEMLDFHELFVLQQLKVPFRNADHRETIKVELDQIQAGKIFKSILESTDTDKPSMINTHTRYLENCKASRMFIFSRKDTGALKTYIDAFQNSAEMGAGTSLVTFLSKPIQRISEYLISLKEIDGYTSSAHPDKIYLAEAISRLQDLEALAMEKKKMLNDIEMSEKAHEAEMRIQNSAREPEPHMHRPNVQEQSYDRGITQISPQTDQSYDNPVVHDGSNVYDIGGLISPYRKFICKGSVWEVINSNLVKERSLFLFSDIMIIAKELLDEESNGNSSFLVKTIVDMSEIALKTERNDDPHEVMMQAPSLRKAVYKFESDPKKGITYLIEKGILTAKPSAVALFLYRTAELNKRQLGRFLGAPDNIAILKAFLDCFDFSYMRIDEALRLFFLSFRLPGEPRVIDSILGTFAERFVETNPKFISSPELALKLTFAILMLNADVHRKTENPNPVRMRLEEFVQKFRVHDPSCSISDSSLHDIYHSIRLEKIAVAAEQEDEEADQVPINFSPIPFRVTYKEFSVPIKVSIPNPDPELRIKIFPHRGVKVTPSVLSFESSSTATFRITGDVLGRKGISFLKLGQNAKYYKTSSVPFGKFIVVEPPFMKHVFQLKTKKRDSSNGKRVSYMFSVASEPQKDNWCQQITNVLYALDEDVELDYGLPVHEGVGLDIIHEFVTSEDGSPMVPTDSKLLKSLNRY